MMATQPAPARPRRATLGGLKLLLCFALCSGGFLRAQVVTDTDGPLQPNHDLTTGKHPLTNDTIERMVKAGIDDSIVLQSIKTQPGRYDLAPDDLIALKQAGVSTRVMAAMQARATGLVVRSDEPDQAAMAGTPAAYGIDEIGVYYKDRSGVWIRLKVERVDFRSGGWVKSAFTHNIIKEDKNGSIDGPHSGLVLPTGVQILIYAPEGTLPEEYDLLRFREHTDRREFRVYTGGVFHNETGTDRDGVEFTPHKLGPRLYQFTVPVDIEKGDYGVLPPGNANMTGASGSAKIFTFRIAE